MKKILRFTPLILVLALVAGIGALIAAPSAPALLLCVLAVGGLFTLGHLRNTCPTVNYRPRGYERNLRWRLAALLMFGGTSLVLANADPGTWSRSKTYLSDEVLTTRYLLGKIGSDASHIATCGAADCPVGLITDEAKAIGDEVNVNLFPLTGETARMIGSEAIAAGAEVYTAASGKVQDEPAVAGTYYLVGRAITACAGNNKEFVVVPCIPLKLVVLALPGNVNSEIGALTSSANTTQAEFNALRDKCEELADDFRAMAAAGSSPCLFKWLAA